MDEQTFRELLGRISDTVIEDMVAEDQELTAQNYVALLQERFNNFAALVS